MMILYRNSLDLYKESEKGESLKKGNEKGTNWCCLFTLEKEGILLFGYCYGYMISQKINIERCVFQRLKQ